MVKLELYEVKLGLKFKLLKTNKLSPIIATIVIITYYYVSCVTIISPIIYVISPIIYVKPNGEWFYWRLI